MSKTASGYSANSPTRGQEIKKHCGKKGDYGHENKTLYFLLISTVLSGTCFLSIFFNDFKDAHHQDDLGVQQALICFLSTLLLVTSVLQE